MGCPPVGTGRMAFRYSTQEASHGELTYQFSPECSNKDWVSLLKKHRNLETNSFVLKDAAGQPIRLAGPHIAVEDLVPLIPPTAYRAVTVGDKTYWTFTLAVRLPGLGQVRLVVSFKNAELTGTYAVLVSNRVDWHAQRILTLYVQRWPIEISQPHYCSRERLSLTA